MALQGTTDSFPVVDVLGLLSASAKTGCLELTGDRGHGSLWLRDGTIVDGGVDGHPTTDAAEVVFGLLLFEQAGFEFVVDDEAPSERFEVSVTEAVAQAEQMLGDWQRVRELVPDVSMSVTLAAAIDGEEVTLSAADWSFVACCAAQPTVGGILEELGLGEFAGCSRLADLVERRLVEVSEVDRAPQDTAEVSEESLIPDEVVPAAASEHFAETPPTPGADWPDAETDFADDDRAAAGEVHQGEPVSFTAAHPQTGRRDADVHQHAPTVPVAPAAPDAFPDHFPIDDLVGSGEHAGFDASFPTETQQGGSAFSGGPETRVPFGQSSEQADGGESAPTDDVLAQIGRLSPKAAEAIAAALGDGEEG